MQPICCGPDAITDNYILLSTVKRRSLRVYEGEKVPQKFKSDVFRAEILKLLWKSPQNITQFCESCFKTSKNNPVEILTGTRWVSFVKICNYVFTLYEV